MVLFFSFVISTVISLIIIPLLMRHAGLLNMLDEPGERKVHTVAIPRCGGLGLAIGALIAILLSVPLEAEIISLIAGCMVIIIFGILDDQIELSYKWKFLGQFLAVFVVMYGGLHISIVPFLGFEPSMMVISIPLTVVFVIGVTNAVNLSDGLDGLAAGIMLMTYAAIAYLAIDGHGIVVAVMALAVAGGIVGFLWFNTHPAIVFMGDTGSQFIGFMAVFLAIYLTQEVNTVLNPALPLLLLGVPILDTISVMVRRIRAGKSPFSPDKTHIHHQFMQYGFSHGEAVGSIYLLQSIFLTFALVFRYSSDVIVIGIYLSFSAIILFFFYWAGENKWQLHKSIEGRDRRRSVLLRSNGLFQFCRHYINFALATFLLAQLYCLTDRITEMTNEVYLVILAIFALFVILPRYGQDIWVRFSIYIAAIFASVMSHEFPEMSLQAHWIMDIFLLVLIIVVSMAIRITRRTKFRVTTQDILVVLFIIASVLLIDLEGIKHVTFRLFCLVYALEYLLHREIYIFRLSRYTAAMTGIVIMAAVIPTII